jgi:hypothetical protein
VKRPLIMAAATASCLALGAGSASAIVYSPSSLTFGAQTNGTVSPPQEVRVGGGSCGPDFFDGMNIVPGPCFPEASDIAVSGQFVITGNTCPASLSSPTATSILSCSVFVAFAPTSVGTQDGFLRLGSSPSIVGVPLSGNGCVRKPKGGLRCHALTKKKKKKKKGKKHAAAATGPGRAAA